MTNIQRWRRSTARSTSRSRLMVVALLAEVTEADFQYLHQATGLTKGNLSVHLSKLEAAGYIAIEKTFRRK